MEFGTISFILIFMPLIVLISICIKDIKINNIVLVLFNRILLYSYLILILGILILFKYYELFNTLNKDIAINIITPLGISFFVFQSIGYILDGYKSKIYHWDNILEFMVFNSLFATFISGLILKYDEESN